MFWWSSEARIWRSLRKRREDEVGVHPALHQLDGDTLTILVVGAHGQINRAHPAAPDFAHHPVRADAATDHWGVQLCGGDRRRQPLDGGDPSHVECGAGDELAGLLVGR